MNLNHQIISKVNESISELCDKFKSNPTFFFTENDLVCYFYGILLKKLTILKVHDKGYCLIHTEYPTPFRCDMSNNEFKSKNDEERTEKRTKYKRGHYDLVVLNPEFIDDKTCYEVIKAQNYEVYKEEVLLKPDRCKPIILYGLEFMYARDPLKYSRGEDKEKGIKMFAKKVKQDYGKLLEAKKMNGFMEQVKMLTFVKGSLVDIQNKLRNELPEEEIILCFAE